MARSINRVALGCSLLALAAATGGCQRGPTWNLAPVEGTITKDGRPLANIRVIFLAVLDTGTQGLRSSGITDEAGHYRLRTDNGDDGAVVGKHHVLILDLEARKGRMGRTARGPQSMEATQLPPEDAKRPEEQRVPPRYERFNETPLRAEVGREPLTFDIVIP